MSFVRVRTQVPDATILFVKYNKKITIISKPKKNVTFMYVSYKCNIFQHNFVIKITKKYS